MRARDRRVPHGELGTAPLRRAVPVFAWILIVAAALYAAVAALVWYGQERLLFNPPPPHGPPQVPAGWRAEAIEHQTADGTRLSGVLLLPARPRPPLVIYFGGNAEEVTASSGEVETEYGQRAVLLVNYRGYGASAGHASEKALVSDALSLYDAMARRDDLAGVDRDFVHMFSS